MNLYSSLQRPDKFLCLPNEFLRSLSEFSWGVIIQQHPVFCGACGEMSACLLLSSGAAEMKSLHYRMNHVPRIHFSLPEHTDSPRLVTDQAPGRVLAARRG